MEQLGEQFLIFCTAAIKTIGVDATIQLLELLTNIITEEPVLAKKLANPDTQVKLMEMSKKMKGKTMGPIELMGMLPEIKQVFM